VLLIHALDGQTLSQLSPQFWSIGTEAQIYLWLPFVIVPLARWKSIEWAVTASLLVSCITFLFPPIHGACLHYVFTFTLGVYAADAAFNQSPRKARSKALTLFAILGQAVLVAFFAETRGSTFGLQDTLLTIPFALLLYFLASSDARNGVVKLLHWVLSSRLCAFFGKISYSLYLVHYVVIAAVHSLALQYALPIHVTVLLLMIVAPILSTALATIMRQLVEAPAMRLSSRFRHVKPAENTT
jgi:peptidoglycan/LPS O-acetylase OafA/YrhL